MATIRDVAHLASVSVSTVSLTFSNPGRVGEQTAKRVWDAAEELGYQPNPLAQSLRRGSAQMIGVVFGDIANPLYGEMLRCIEKNVLSAGYHVVVSDSNRDSMREVTAVERLAAQRVSGIILCRSGAEIDYERLRKSVDVPIVVLDQKLDRLDLDFVGCDAHLGLVIMTEHLLRLGHEKIAFIGGPLQLWTSTERERGFRDAHDSRGVEVDESLVVNGCLVDSKAYAKTMRLMTGKIKPTAIIAAHNMMGLASLKAIQELGVKCPEEVSLAMVDDVPWASVIRPQLTTIKQDIPQIVDRATKFLIERINLPEGTVLPARETILSPELVLGNSTASVPKYS